MADLKVLITSRDAACGECGEDLGRRAWITLVEDKGAPCLSCADPDHLLFLPAGNTALTRRSCKYSSLVAVVLKWSRARKRYERQGLLVQAEALDRAEQECLEDGDLWALRREREAIRRIELDQQYVERFAQRVRDLYPACPPGIETVIAEHACLKYSDRVGRSAAAKEFDEQAIRLAVTAHVRHTETDYDSLLAGGHDRGEARSAGEAEVTRVLSEWRSG